MENQTSLRFSLQEEIWFQRGQEVAELLSIELNPHVEIQEYSDYIQVKGSLELYGEYYGLIHDEEEDMSLRDVSTVRTVNEVYEREDGVFVMTHYFPVDISIPRNRVNEVDDIYIMIETFDYHCPSMSSLQIMTDLSIVGLVDTLSEEERENQGTDDETEFHHELMQEEFPNNFFEPFELEVRQLPTIDEYEELMVVEEEVVEEPLQPQIEYFSRNEVSYQPDEEPVSLKPVNEEKKEEVRRPENALYLTRLFDRQGEEAFKKMRVYFVQEGDTIDSIADKYSVQVQQITRKNKLEDYSIKTGQMLYLPVKPTKNQ